MDERARNIFPWLVTAITVAGLLYHGQWFGLNTPASSGPAQSVALAGGGTSDGADCGVKGYHFFPITTTTDTGGSLPGTPAGPAMMLGAYGSQQSAGQSGNLTISLLLSTGSPTRTLDLSAPFGVSGVAFEIDGPNGLVAGAHGLPVTLDDPSARQSDGKIRVGTNGLSVDVVVPAAALCPGHNVTDVMKNLTSPTDSQQTITGQPPYTLTVSVSDAAVGQFRLAVKSTATGNVLAANNLVPLPIG